MQDFFLSNYEKLTLKLTIKTSKPERMRIIVKDAKKPNTYYTNRVAMVNGTQSFFIKMPISPQKCLIQVYNEKRGNLRKGEDQSFKIESKQVLPLNEQLHIHKWKNPLIKSFVKFAQQFSNNAGILPAGGAVYQSDDRRFKIVYLDRIIDEQGKVRQTPARINQDKGIIEIAQSKFIHYTVPMRMMILMHEFAHFYMNGRMADEIEADLNALIIYLGIGYPRIEAYQAWTQVFANADTPGNRARLKVIDNFIEKFDRTPFYIKYE